MVQQKYSQYEVATLARKHLCLLQSCQSDKKKHICKCSTKREIHECYTVFCGILHGFSCHYRFTYTVYSMA